MKKQVFTPLQTALITFLVAFVLSPLLLLPAFYALSYLNSSVSLYLSIALICAGFAWVIATVQRQRAHIAELHAQIELLTDHANVLTEHINALEATGEIDSAAETSLTPEKD